MADNHYLPGLLLSLDKAAEEVPADSYDYTPVVFSGEVNGQMVSFMAHDVISDTTPDGEPIVIVELVRP